MSKSGIERGTQPAQNIENKGVFKMIGAAEKNRRKAKILLFSMPACPTWRDVAAYTNQTVTADVSHDPQAQFTRKMWAVDMLRSLWTVEPHTSPQFLPFHWKRNTLWPIVGRGFVSAFNPTSAEGGRAK